MTKQIAKLSTPVDAVIRLTMHYDPASDGWFLYGYADEEQETPTTEMWHMTEEDAKADAAENYNVSNADWESADNDDVTPTRDCNGTVLKDGDTVTLIKDLDVKGAGTTLKRGTTVKNISLTNDPELIDCRTKEVKGLVLKTCFVKKL